MSEIILSDLARLGSELTIIATILVIAVCDLAMRTHPKRRHLLVAIAIIGLSVSAYLTSGIAEAQNAPKTLFSGMLALDGFAVFCKWLVLLASSLGIIFGALSDEISLDRYAEYILSLLCITLGLMLLVSAQHLLMLYLAIELVSLPSYILTGFRRGDQRASEAALKYVIYGAAASGLMLYGFSLLYGLTGTLCLTEIGPKLVAAADGTFPAQLAIAMAALLSLVGFAFKVAAVPFHAWCPDVYEGAPTPFVAFLSVAPKIAGLAALMRFLFVGFGLHDNIFSPGIFPWQVIIGIISIATMTLGNLAALAQDNIKRMLAYSSIAHAGYLLMGLSVGTEDAMRAIMLYLPIYLLMNMGIFLAVIAIRAHTNSEQISAFRGLGSTNPLLAVSVCIFLFSLVGIPPFAGFIAKFYVFLAAIKTELNFFYVLAAIAVINSVISLFYYARIARAMFFEQPTEERTQTWRVNLISAIIIVLLVIPTILLGIYWVPLAEIIENTGALLGI